MIPYTCQSCGLPFTKEMRGTNRDKTFNNDYCINCFRDGEFTNHHLTLHQLEIQLLEMAEVHNGISLEEAQQIIRKLPELKRWRMNNI
ncbi:zinc ribbon domain-containing protein [Salegentibacter sediminis]|uniref:zinc ribbon domain-containing protein n=1 Tax=Salegentibacter sediminis TaxID=1930251 RepID=UPI0009BCA97C|nr:zinc ribbon domain-containing protein [Salegentibacter sediminis]